MLQRQKAHISQRRPNAFCRRSRVLADESDARRHCCSYYDLSICTVVCALSWVSQLSKVLWHMRSSDYSLQYLKTIVVAIGCFSLPLSISFQELRNQLSIIKSPLFFLIQIICQTSGLVVLRKWPIATRLHPRQAILRDIDWILCDTGP